MELRISVLSDGCLELVQTISESFPLLKVLELHRYPTTTPTSPQPFDVREISLALASLPRLAELRLGSRNRPETGNNKQSTPRFLWTATVTSHSIATRSDRPSEPHMPPYYC
ncbi:hypothetical protein JB92DRAFT_442101 [Gautieria morchelliformis]|nr:hypothetical protein JB92DRAFT_442101 [Gautieria morchelliformis]